MITHYGPPAISVSRVDHGTGDRIGIHIRHPLFHRSAVLYMTPDNARRLAATLLAFAEKTTP